MKWQIEAIATTLSIPKTHRCTNQRVLPPLCPLHTTRNIANQWNAKAVLHALIVTPTLAPQVQKAHQFRITKCNIYTRWMIVIFLASILNIRLLLVRRQNRPPVHPLRKHALFAHMSRCVHSYR